MLKILHRVNDPAQLHKLPNSFGVEMDLHAYGNHLVVHHDAFNRGFAFSEWLDNFRHSLVILNIKEEGIEQRVLDEVLARKIDNFFMLDLSVPALIRMTGKGESRCAVRVSKYEGIADALKLAGRAEWVWVDMFDGFPFDRSDLKKIQVAGFKICFASPELHGQDKSMIMKVRKLIDKTNIRADAVCTKYPDLW